MNMAQFIFIVVSLLSLFLPVSNHKNGTGVFMGYRTIRFFSDFCIVFMSLIDDHNPIGVMRIIKFGSDLRMAVVTNIPSFNPNKIESNEIKAD